MPESVLYLRGFPGTGRFDTADPTMLADFKLIAGLSNDQVQVLSNELERQPGFLHTEALRECIGAYFQDEKTVLAVLRALQSLEPDDLDRVLKQVDHARNAEKQSTLDDAKMTNLRQNLSILIRIYPALVRFEKAQRLAKLTGQRLESADLICDLRPIFDSLGERVEGMFPYTRLRLVATGADGLPRDFEAELTVEQVYGLFESSRKAKTKLDALRKTLKEWIPGGFPDLPETRIPKEQRNA